MNTCLLALDVPCLPAPTLSPGMSKTAGGISSSSQSLRSSWPLSRAIPNFTLTCGAADGFCNLHLPRMCKPHPTHEQSPCVTCMRDATLLSGISHSLAPRGLLASAATSSHHPSRRPWMRHHETKCTSSYLASGLYIPLKASEHCSHMQAVINCAPGGRVHTHGGSHSTGELRPVYGNVSAVPVCCRASKMRCLTALRVWLMRHACAADECT